MKDIKTKEHLLHFMQSGFMSLSKYDLKFVQNLLHIASNSNAITTNQEWLFKRLLEKYKRQLEKHQFTTTVIEALPWVAKIKPSDPHYTEAYIEIENSQIYFKAPYNKNFINSFREMLNNPFKWDKENRRYSAIFSTLALKCVVNASAKHYPIINYCPITIKLLNSLLVFEHTRVWDPTLVKVNDSYIIAGANEAVITATNDILLNDDLRTLSTLAEYGVTIDPSITKDDPKLLFASQFRPQVDYVNVDTVISWLVELGCDGVILDNLGIDLTYRKAIKAKLGASGISAYDNAFFLNHMSSKTKADVVKSLLYPVKIEFSTFQTLGNTKNLKKVIKMTNSTPINIK